MGKPKHILVIRLSAMGDVAISVPVIRELVNENPNLRLTVLTRGFFSPLFEGIPNLTVFEADLKGNHKGIWGLFKLSRELRKHQIDAVADIHNVLRSKILRFFLMDFKSAAIDKGRAEKKALVSGKLFSQLKTSAQRYADVFDTLGYPLNLSKPQFPKRKTLNDKVLSILGKDHLKWVGIAPFAAHKGKMYPLDLMEKVISKLAEQHKVLLFGGGEDEIKQLKKLENPQSNIVNLAGKLQFQEELDVISNLDVMISMDSGNGHLAAMKGVKVITVWGVTHPYAGFTPFNQPSDYSLVPNRKMFPQIPTSIYGNKYPKDYQEAARTISPETIVNKVNAII
ncbi:glycosyltransferase family 9 protein [Mangrovimonas sp. CR14]|uniref:glycosyltransferase family 9 protein n=1 Tax=Mangrovimonas sp. CR14 TaxID=2706120 RepID=UPI001F0D548F|nr:glycosyltransferase family 9 protein [Mangrovimonas sp. CR14]